MATCGFYSTLATQGSLNSSFLRAVSFNIALGHGRMLGVGHQGQERSPSSIPVITFGPVEGHDVSHGSAIVLLSSPLLPPPSFFVLPFSPLLPLPPLPPSSTSSPNHHIHSYLSFVCPCHGYHSSMRNHYRRHRHSLASLSSSPVRCSIRGVLVGPRIKTSYVSIPPSSTSTLRAMEPSRRSSTDHFHFNNSFLY